MPVYLWERKKSIMENKMTNLTDFEKETLQTLELLEDLKKNPECLDFRSDKIQPVCQFHWKVRDLFSIYNTLQRIYGTQTYHIFQSFLKHEVKRRMEDIELLYFTCTTQYTPGGDAMLEISVYSLEK